MKRLVGPSGLAAVLCIAFALTAGVGCRHTAATVEEEEGEDAVDVGYGRASLRDVTGSVAHFSTEEISERPVARVEELLEGRIAGVRVVRTVGGFKVVVRGASSFAGYEEPLYVIDGLPVVTGPGGGVTGLNPSDVAEITVLKDAASTAIYGSRGANGVILIRTKSGR